MFGRKQADVLDESIASLARHKVLVQFTPCSEDDMKAVELAAGGPLPRSYAKFLRTMGRGAGLFWRGTDAFYPDILELRPAVEELMRESRTRLELPDDAFVIYLHQGYEYAFFRLEEGDDPPVYQYFEGHDGLAFTWPDFAHFFRDSVRSYLGET